MYKKSMCAGGNHQVGALAQVCLLHPPIYRFPHPAAALSNDRLTCPNMAISQPLASPMLIDPHLPLDTADTVTARAPLSMRRPPASLAVLPWKPSHYTERRSLGPMPGRCQWDLWDGSRTHSAESHGARRCRWAVQSPASPVCPCGLPQRPHRPGGHCRM